MTDQHPITPPPELAAQWVAEIYGDPVIPLHPITLRLVERAAQWGADEELESTLSEVFFLGGKALVDRVRAARRPKPPSLKEQALAAMREMQIEPCVINGVDTNAAVRAKYDIIRRALEALSDD